MKSAGKYSIYTLLMLVANAAARSTQFSSHVSVSTPARSFSHGVGDPVSTMRRPYQHRAFAHKSSIRTLRRLPSQSHNMGGYPRLRPTIPFNAEERPYHNDIKTATWHLSNFQDTYVDPYLIEGTEAIAAVKRSNGHGLLYFSDIPHINSLLANQELRVKNNLKPHRLGSIRHTWPYYRP